MSLHPSITAQRGAKNSAGGALPDVRPWWKEPYVWMVISGPLSAVLACAITAFYILQGPDAVVSENSYPQGVEISHEVKTAAPPMLPAQAGRNHSATGGRIDGKP